MEDFAIIFNPTSAAGKSKKQFKIMENQLSDLGVYYKLFKTERTAHAIDLAEHLAKKGYKIIAAGGDGTCNEVLNGVIRSETNTLLGFIPIGTGNDIPGAIGYRPYAVENACKAIAEGYTEKVDIGLAITENGNKRYFLGIGSQGFDALVTKRTNEGRKWLPGTWNYVVSMLKTVLSFKRKRIKVTLDDEIWEGNANLVAVGNGPTYGGWMYICPRARVDDGLFHITIVDMKTSELLKKFKLMYSRTLHPDKHIYEFISKTVKIEMVNEEDEPFISQVDGEVIGATPIHYKILPLHYEFIRPRNNEAEEWFQEKNKVKFKKHLKRLVDDGNDYWNGYHFA